MVCRPVPTPRAGALGKRRISTLRRSIGGPLLRRAYGIPRNCAISKLTIVGVYGLARGVEGTAVGQAPSELIVMDQSDAAHPTLKNLSWSANARFGTAGASRAARVTLETKAFGWPGTTFWFSPTATCWSSMGGWVPRGAIWAREVSESSSRSVANVPYMGGV